MRILAINPGSTSTKIGVFTDSTSEFELTLRHSAEELAPFDKITEQYDFRKYIILNTLKEKDVDIASFDAIVGRGGLVKPIEGGTYEVNEAMSKDLLEGIQGEHASNLGGLIANEIAKSIGKRAFIVDPVVVDEFEDVSRVAGHPLFVRRSVFHALNQKAIAHAYSDDIKKPYNELNLIVAHMGGGISVGAHKKGRVVDVNNALDGDGPFSPERSGDLPVGDLIELCFSEKYTKKQVKEMIKPKGGLLAYFNTTDVKDLMERRESEPEVKLVMDALFYQVSKEIGALAAALDGQVDAILLTGGLVYNQAIVDAITAKVKFIAPVKAYPGEDELKALVQGTLRVLNNQESAKTYN